MLTYDNHLFDQLRSTTMQQTNPTFLTGRELEDYRAWYNREKRDRQDAVEGALEPLLKIVERLENQKND